jgi:hypothetical protein
LLQMSKYLGCLNDTKMNIPLKLYHKINSLGAVGGCRGPTHTHPRPPGSHNQPGQFWANFKDDFEDDFETIVGRFWDDFEMFLRQFWDNFGDGIETIEGRF